MKWAKTIKHQTSISLNSKIFNILCEDSGSIAVSINGEYIFDVETLPKYEELVNIIKESEFIELEINEAMAIQQTWTQ